MNQNYCYCRSQDSTISTVTRLRAERYWQRQEIILFSKTSELVLKLTQLPILKVAEALSSGVKWPGHEADHSPPSSAQVKNEWGYISTPH